MVIREGIPAALVVVFAVLWLLWLPVVVVVALVQKRTIGLAILFGTLLGPFFTTAAAAEAQNRRLVRILVP